MSGGAGWAVQRLAAGWVGLVVVAVLAGTLLAQRSLASACRRGGAGARGARGSTARGGRWRGSSGAIPESLDEAGVARAAVESLAENFSDGVVAPVFWLAVAGLPGAAAYKAVNTADSMIGHRSERHRAFGWAAARLDDLLNLPASRLAALLLVGGGGAGAGGVAARGVAGGAAGRAAGIARRTPGWPEAAMAGALGLRAGGAAALWRGAGRGRGDGRGRAAGARGRRHPAGAPALPGRGRAAASRWSRRWRSSPGQAEQAVEVEVGLRGGGRGRRGRPRRRPRSRGRTAARRAGRARRRAGRRRRRGRARRCRGRGRRRERGALGAAVGEGRERAGAVGACRSRPCASRSR